MNPELDRYLDEMRRHDDEEQARDEAWERRMRHRFLCTGQLEPDPDEKPILKPKPHAGISDPESWD